METPRARKTLLVIDDDREFCRTVRDYFGTESVRVLVAHHGAEGLKLCASEDVEVVLLDQRLPDRKGEDLCPAILGQNDQIKIIFITAYPSFDNAVAAIRAGAYDYLSKPFEIEELKLAIERSFRTWDLERVEQLNSYRSRQEVEQTVLVGEGKRMQEVARLVQLAASTDAPVLITGETGTGKNVVAKAIHYTSPAQRAAFVSINCTALPENLVEAELFGVERGAYTGAVSSRRGLFEMADGGTILLDEIGSMPLQLQAKLLGVLEDKKIRRLGSPSAKRISARIIAATNLNLETAIMERGFREDLYFRLNVIRIHVPPLRERPEDIPALCSHLLRQLDQGRVVTVPDSETTRLIGYDWPGNVRELRNVLERASLLQTGPTLFPSELLRGTETFLHRDREASSGPAPVPCQAPSPQSEPLSLADLERNHIAAVLSKLDGNVARTARALGISLSTLKRKLKAARAP